ncbi:MAG: short-chain dehydrogenase [Acidobacteria bacterium]|nr:MAG: short-chain dehydrogenase [Acidobacteriota bacterium]
MGRLDEKVAIVTGGGVGIGKAIARSLAAEGAKIVLAGRSMERLVQTAQETAALGSTVVPIPTDVTDEAQVNSLFKRTMDLFHRVDIMVNNAGATDGGPLSEMSVEMWDKVIATNLKGPFLCTRSAMRIMKSQGGGRILNIGSISAQRPRVNSAPYASSKFGLVGLTTVTALEGREFGISACCLHPGNVQIESSAEEIGAICGIPGYSSEPMMKVEEIAEVATLMACLPPHMNMFEAIVLPVKQAYLGRG